MRCGVLKQAEGDGIEELPSLGKCTVSGTISGTSPTLPLQAQSER